jgi:hypothetical protein
LFVVQITSSFSQVKDIQSDTLTFIPYKKGTFGLNLHGGITNDFDFYFSSNSSISILYFDKDNEAIEALFSWNGTNVIENRNNENVRLFGDFDPNQLNVDTTKTNVKNENYNLSNSFAFTLGRMTFIPQSERFALIYSRGWYINGNLNNSDQKTENDNFNSGNSSNFNEIISRSNSRFGLGTGVYARAGIDYRIHKRINIFALYTARIGVSYVYIRNRYNIENDYSISTKLNDKQTTHWYNIDYYLSSFSIGARILFNKLDL